MMIQTTKVPEAAMSSNIMASPMRNLVSAGKEIRMTISTAAPHKCKLSLVPGAWLSIKAEADVLR
jgi:hypothetical protein